MNEFDLSIKSIQIVVIFLDISRKTLSQKWSTDLGAGEQSNHCYCSWKPGHLRTPMKWRWWFFSRVLIRRWRSSAHHVREILLVHRVHACPREPQKRALRGQSISGKMLTLAGSCARSCSAMNSWPNASFQLYLLFCGPRGKAWNYRGLDETWVLGISRKDEPSND
jgi:hypothetical protein